MAKQYTREYLIAAFVSRYEPLGLQAVESQHRLATQLYDRVDRDEFRRYCSLDAKALEHYNTYT
jgi:hypothetical protein